MWALMGEIKGYKVFDSQIRNMYGMKFEVGKVYSTEGLLKFRDDASLRNVTGCNGFHMCVNLEDTFRYVGDKEDYVIAEVTGYFNTKDDYICNNDSLYDIYDLYAVRSIKIDRILKREEIIEYGLKLELHRKRHFVNWLPFKMNFEEIKLFKEDYYVYKDVAYFHEGDKKAYTRGRIR